MESKNIMKTDLTSNVGIAEIRLDQVVTVLDKQLANDYYFLFSNVLQFRLCIYCTSPRI